MVVKKRCDVFLDTDVFNAHGTATDVLWGGVPIVTVGGVGYHSRVAECHVRSVLKTNNNVDVSTWQAYEDVAVGLGQNSTRRALLRAEFEGGRLRPGSLFNTALWASDFHHVIKVVERLRRAGLPRMHVTAVRPEVETTTVSDLVKDQYGAKFGGGD